MIDDSECVYTHTHTHTQSVIIIIMIGSNLYLPKQGSNIKEYGPPFGVTPRIYSPLFKFLRYLALSVSVVLGKGGGGEEGFSVLYYYSTEPTSIFNPSQFSWFTMWLPHGSQAIIF